MNSLVIPPSPNWYESWILACAPDNTLVYGARNDIVLIWDAEKDQPAEVEIIPKAHSQKIISVNINISWGQPNKYVVTVGEDKIVKLWNIDTLKKKFSHSVHRIHNGVVGATFAGDERIVSISEEGGIVVWNLGVNQPNLLKDIFGFKVFVTCLSTCPHAGWLTAFGLKNGLIIVTDLRKQGKVLYKFRGHDRHILSLSWCPAPVNIFPKDPKNYVGLRKVTSDENSTPEGVESLKDDSSTNIEDYNKNNDETVVPSTSSSNYKPKKDLWTNLVHADDEDLPEDYKEKEKTHPLLRVYELEDDFLKECQKLKNRILGVDTSDVSSDKENIEEKEERPVLKATKRQKCKSPARSNESQGAEGKAEEKLVTEEVVKDEDNNLNEKCDTQNTDIKAVENELEEVSVEDKAEVNAEEDVNNVDKTSEAALDLVKDEQSTDDIQREIPVDGPIEEEPRKEFLLASSAKDGCIYIWRAGTDGREQTRLKLPGKNNRKYSKPHEKAWITVYWISPKSIVSSSKTGELLQWNLPSPRDTSRQYRVIHNDHRSFLFSIAGPTVLLNDTNWLDVDDKKCYVWTTGQDRLLLKTSLSNMRTNLVCYPTIGVVHCFAPSPIDPTRLAIGTAEGIIKIWDLSLPHTSKIAMTNFYQKIQSKVVSLAWHPTNEDQLAYGTMEGRIGYLNISNKSKSPTLLPNFFKSQVHKIEWGPQKGDEEALNLYAVAEGKLITYDPTKPEKDPKEIDMPGNTSVYTFAWKPNYKTMLVSTKTGGLVVCSSDLKILSKHYLQHKLQEIVWHPSACESDRAVAKCCDWFASISNTKEIVVYDSGSDADNYEQKIVAKYEATDMINCLAWNPFEETQLAIAGDDGIVQIWDASTQVVMATFINPNFEGVLAVTWSPLDPDYVISAGKDHTIRIWKISDYPVRSEDEIRAMKKNRVKDDPAHLPPKVEKPKEEHSTANKNNLLPQFYNPKNKSQMVADGRRLLAWKENPDTVVQSQPGDYESDILKIFGSKIDMLEIVVANQDIHKMKGRYDMKDNLSFLTGDLRSAVKEAIEEKRVTPWIIKFAHIVSPKLWRTACEVYAQQLSEEAGSDPWEIATYYLGCHKVPEAINVLCEGSMFREALALARCRLPEDDPLITKVVEKWALHSFMVGNFEIAAHCQTFLGKYGEAACSMFRRSDIDALQFAMDLAKKADNEELYKAISFRYDSFKTANSSVSNGKLPSRIEVMLEQCHRDDENRARNGEISASLSDDGLTSGLKDEATGGGELKRSSSLGENFKVQTSDQGKPMEGVNGEDALTTEKDEKLLDELSVGAVNGSLDSASADASKY